MELEQQVNLVASIHDTLEGYLGKRLALRANMGRSKIIQNEGTLVQVHPQLFIMEVEHRRGRKARQSYQYVDVLTGTVELSYEGESLFKSLIAQLTAEPNIEPLPEPVLADRDPFED